MAYNKLYRNFIILQEDESCHSSSEDKPLSGYAKIEAKSDKCKISFYAQNLKKGEKYSIVLICYRKDMKQIVDLGFLDVSDVGKGEAVKEYYVNNIAGLNFSYEKISGAAICKHKNEGLSFLMYGFMNNENIKEDWKKSKVVKCADKTDYDIEKIIKDSSKKEYKKNHDDDHDHKHHEKHDHDEDKHDHHEKCDYDEDKHDHHEKHDHDEDKHDHHEKHDHDEDKYDHHEKYDYDDDKHDYHEKHDHDEDKHDHYEKHDHHEKYDHDEDKHDYYEDKYEQYEKDKWEEKKKEEYHKHNEDYECDVKCHRGSDDGITSRDFDEYEILINKSKENQEIDPYDFKLRGAIGDFFNNITKGFEEVKGKFKEIKYCKWFKVKINSIDDMCNTADYNKYTVAYYPMLNYYPYIKKYGYFFIGYKCDSNGNLKYIVYGVPGKKDKDEQPYVGKTGFVTWISSDDDKNGCWLMFYDFKNSNIVVPMK